MYMTTKTIFASCAKAAFALAAVVMMSAAFTSCSKDNDNNDGRTTPLPEPKAQTMTIDGIEKPITKATYEDRGTDKCWLRLFPSNDEDEVLKLELSITRHITGKLIDLTQREKPVNDTELYWSVRYFVKGHNTTLLGSWGNPDASSPLFTTGTLTVSNPTGNSFTIVLRNGRVIGINDGKEHTITVSYSGQITKE